MHMGAYMQVQPSFLKLGGLEEAADSHRKEALENSKNGQACKIVRAALGTANFHWRESASAAKGTTTQSWTKSNGVSPAIAMSVTPGKKATIQAQAPTAMSSLCGFVPISGYDPKSTATIIE